MGTVRRKPNCFNLVHQLRVMQRIKPSGETDVQERRC